jgi:hypothetical protein
MKKLLFLLLFFIPFPAFAFSDPTMADCAFLNAGGASCSVDTIIFPGGQNIARYGDTGAGLYFVPGTTYYVTYTVTGSGTLRVNFAANVVDGTPVDIAGSQTDLPVTAPSFGGNSWIAVYFDDTQGFSGTVSGICVSDHVGGCSPPVPPPATTTPPTYVDNYNQDTFNIVLLFLMSAWGAVWLFRKRN